MKKLAPVFALLLALSAVTSFFSVNNVNATDENSWTTLTPLPNSSFSTLGAAAVDGRIFYFGGNISARYDPETNIWTNITPLPVYNDWGTVVACQNKIYLIGGDSEIPTQVYDPKTDTWENRTAIPTTRNMQQANVIDDKIYVISGQIPSALGVINPSSATDLYDPETDTWSQMAPIPTPVMGYASAVLEDKIYVVGGGVANDAEYASVDVVQIFDTTTNQWTNGSSIPTGVCYARASATTGLFAPERIYVLGGTMRYYFRYGFITATNLTQVYNPETDTWTTGAPMPTNRGKMGVAVVNDEIYAIGGQNSEDWTVAVYANEKCTPTGFGTETSEFGELELKFVVLVTFTVLSLAVTVFAARKLVIHRHSKGQ